MDRLEHYNSLMTMTYDEAVAILQGKYGLAKDDYYRDKSYKRFLKKLNQ